MSAARRRSAAVLLLATAVAGCSAAPAARTSPTVPPTPFPSVVATPSPTQESQAPPALLAEAVEATIATGSVGVAMDITFEGGSTIPDGTSMHAVGGFGFEASRHARLAMDMEDLGAGTFVFIQDGDVMYLKFEGELATLVPDGMWVRIDETSDGDFAAAFKNIASGPNDSTLLLYYLLGATGEGRIMGSEQVDGVKTTRVRTDLDLDLATDLVPAAVRDALVINVGMMRRQGLDGTLQAEAWIGEDDLVYKERLTYTLPVTMGGGTMTALTTYRDHGEELDLGIPADKDVIPADEVELPGS